MMNSIDFIPVWIVETLKTPPEIKKEDPESSTRYRKWLETQEVGKSITELNKLLMKSDYQRKFDVISYFVKQLPLEGCEKIIDLLDCYRYLRPEDMKECRSLLKKLAFLPHLDSFEKLRIVGFFYEIEPYNYGDQNPFDFALKVSSSDGVTLEHKCELMKLVMTSGLDEYISLARETFLNEIKKPEHSSQKRLAVITDVSKKKLKVCLCKTHKIWDLIKEEDGSSPDWITHLHFSMGCHHHLLETIKNSLIPQDIRVGLLCCQYLLGKDKGVVQDYKASKIQYLYDIAKNVDLEENIRADSLDILYRCGDSEDKMQAKKMLLEDIGFSRKTKGMNPRTVYNNSQNVHYIEKQVDDFLSSLVLTFGTSLTTETVLEKVLLEVGGIIPRISKNTESKRKAQESLNRIKIDSATFGNSHLTLLEVLSLVWNKIKSYPDSDTSYNSAYFQEILVEELEDMSGTCASGHVARLVNVFSGAEDALKLDFESQIIANAYALLQKTLDTNPKKNEIILGMIKNSEERPYFEDFLVSCLGNIKRSLSEEFVGEGYINQEKFDEAFEKFNKNLSE